MKSAIEVHYRLPSSFKYLNALNVELNLPNQELQDTMRLTYVSIATGS